MIHILIEPNKDSLIYFPNGGKWVRPWLKDTLKLKSPFWKKLDNGLVVWNIPKSKTEKLLKVIMTEEAVTVTQRYSEFTRCTSSCKSATSEHCECACLGLYHGKGEGGNQISIPIDALHELHLHTKVTESVKTYNKGTLVGMRIATETENGIVYQDVPIN